MPWRSDKCQCSKPLPRGRTCQKCGGHIDTNERAHDTLHPVWVMGCQACAERKAYLTRSCNT